ncbi:hypothetical protein MiSe_50560 [Microseira wollei NIES-4236]|uniref:Uncharacterized protein n=1 Tax=Microseira wollei NIES-4236 TaxID=2530354 RepID=A0AAV3XBI4_9CYAN|nr:hypothetical protein MiSe_50560 [Microseira wollei NIES-4236]
MQADQRNSHCELTVACGCLNYPYVSAGTDSSECFYGYSVPKYSGEGKSPLFCPIKLITLQKLKKAAPLNEDYKKFI